jgi:hypothetical protein
MLELDGKYCKIINRFTKKIVASGKIINHKTLPIKCITFDNKYFFNLNKKFLYKFIFCDFCEETKLNIKKYDILHWREVFDNKNYLIYRENDMSELDKEIEPLVYAINDYLHIQTCSSCCGHGRLNAWIDIRFNNMKQLRTIVDLISLDIFKKKFVLTTNDNILQENDDCICLKLRTNSIGEKAYNDIKKLTEYIHFKNN